MSRVEKSDPSSELETPLHDPKHCKRTGMEKIEEDKDEENTKDGKCMYGSYVKFRRNRTMSRDCLCNALRKMEFSIERNNRANKRPNFQVKGEKICMNRFYYEKTLGQGVQGVVFSAYDTRLQRKVAVKKLLNANKEDLDQHKREIKVMKLLKQENMTYGFPELLDYHQGKGNFIVTELLGDSL